MVEPKLQKLLETFKPEIIKYTTSAIIEQVLGKLTQEQIAQDDVKRIKGNAKLLGAAWGAYKLLDCLKSSDEAAFTTLLESLKKNKSAEEIYKKLRSECMKEGLQYVLPASCFDEDDDDFDSNDEEERNQSRLREASLSPGRVSITRSSRRRQNSFDSDGFSSDEEENLPYTMSSTPRGVCLIINNMDFSEARKNNKGYDDRDGSEKDEENLKEVFEWLDFDVKIYRDQAALNMWNKIQEYSSKFDHSKYDCFVACILSHGQKNSENDKDEICGTDGKGIPVDSIIRSFDASSCKSLRDKPKLFLLSCCRSMGEMGERSATKGTVQADGSRFNGQTQSKLSLRPLADPADFFIGFSTFSGCKSLRDKSKGTFYISTLCNVFRKMARKDNLMTMMTKINRKVAAMEHSTQVPNPSMTLRKLLFFNPQTDWRGKKTATKN
ncbi:caspase-8-like [Rhopilema esculentum]|uniref:caspase-8-like n=1 Tax=Rhopilema esculentum TaxID=499914 RepID=UPI0031E1326E|eukprot:gene10355-19055_t